eukprot:CAMPEP_0175460414 /NCGR_PEP_ID=MMETSP0095-20121207/67629_1 /TAXON_ID=311494 /ORGANISM="Alexandrium monilatum, Strain CCMP3105" /LENGTH=74 /DNA_ID=CAMNT_0016761429 /DNA_START=1 /DNA_END=221 /DNA_ORIENTATION=+
MRVGRNGRYVAAWDVQRITQARACRRVDYPWPGASSGLISSCGASLNAPPSRGASLNATAFARSWAQRREGARG